MGIHTRARPIRVAGLLAFRQELERRIIGGCNNGIRWIEFAARVRFSAVTVRLTRTQVLMMILISTVWGPGPYKLTMGWRNGEVLRLAH